MALYQPTNIIPSSYTKGTVDVNDAMEISWQVNGNSAMAAFQIDFYLNDYASTPITSTGKRTDNCPFYGTDRFGRPQFFTWNSRVSWEDKGFTNGNEYKYKITQYYVANENEYYVISSTSTGGYDGTTFYFTLPDNRYVYFRISSDINFPKGTKIYYNTESNQGGYIASNGKSIPLSMTVSNSKPGEPALNMGRATNEIAVTQNSFNVISTRAKPTLIIYGSKADYIDNIDFPNNGNIATSIGFFKAAYKQLQGDPIRWIRWQVATATKNNDGTNNLGEIIADTGDIYTPTLNYEFNGFFNGQQYAIRCFGESESGQECTSGWIFFTINIENQGEYSGEFTVQCLNKENAALLKWEGVEVIPPAISPQGYEPQVADGSVTLNGKNGDTEYSIAWNKVGDSNGNLNEMNFESPWTTALKLKLNLNSQSSSSSIEFSGMPIRGEQTDTKIVIGRTYTPTSKGYKYETTYSYIKGMANIINISINNSTASSYEYSVDNDSKQVTVILYTLLPNQTVYAEVRMQYEYFKISSTKNVDGVIKSYKVLSVSNSIIDYEIKFDNYVATATMYGNNVSDILTINSEIEYNTFLPIGKLFEIQSNDIILSAGNNSFNVEMNGDRLITTTHPATAVAASVIVTSQDINIIYYGNGGEIITKSAMPITIGDWQQDIISVSICGGDSGATVDSVSIYQGDGSNILSLYENPDFKPVWNSDQYELYMTANFNGNLEGGTGTATGSGFRVYRQEIGKNVLTPIATVPSTTTSVKDYGIVSRKAYKYSLYAYDNNGAFMSAVENANVIATCFNNYSLLVCDYDEVNDEYHVRKQYLFALNLSAGSVGNNNSPTLNANFTRYPTRMPSTQNYASGTLQGLIGAIYTVPALIEQIGNYKWTAKPSTLDYFDSVDLEKELYDLSTAPYQLFLRDMKGRLRMIATNGAITMTTNIKQKQQSISISFPWVEIGDASDVTIIQTPDDYGWNNDNQVLDVQLDVDVATGELSATYPFPYNGTKFYLTGANNETLTAKTPLGVTPAQFELSKTAMQPADGEVTAVVKTNSGVNK